MTDYDKNVLRVIDHARKVADEAPEAIVPCHLDFHVKTSLGVVWSGSMHLWLAGVCLVAPTAERSLWKLVSDLHEHLRQAWLSHKIAKLDVATEEAAGQLEELLQSSREALNSSGFTEPDHLCSGTDSYYATLRKGEE